MSRSPMSVITKLQGTGNLYVPSPVAKAFKLVPDGDVSPYVLTEGVIAFVPGRIPGATPLISQAITGTPGAVRIRLRRYLTKWGVGTLTTPLPVTVRASDKVDHKENPAIPVGRALVADLRMILSEGELP